MGSVPCRDLALIASKISNQGKAGRDISVATGAVVETIASETAASEGAALLAWENEGARVPEANQMEIKAKDLMVRHARRWDEGVDAM